MESVGKETWSPEPTKTIMIIIVLSGVLLLARHHHKECHNMIRDLSPESQYISNKENFTPTELHIYCRTIWLYKGEREIMVELFLEIPRIVLVGYKRH